MNYKAKKREIQRKAKGSLAKNLETLNNTNKKFLINVKGFLGYVKTNINIPLNIHKNMKKSTKNVPIYIISGHGENIGNIRISRKSKEKGYPIIEEKRDGQIFELTNDNQWIVHTAPIRSLVCPSKYDQPFLEYLTSDTKNVKNILFSKNPKKLFKNVCYTQEKTKYKTENFSLPGMPYPRKRYWFYDSPEDESSYFWSTGVYPIFKNHNCKIKFYDKINKYRNKKEWDLNGRVFNDYLIDNLNWQGKSKLLNKYKKLTALIKNSLPKFDKTGKKIVKEGKPVYQKEIMNIMGEGIYIVLSCSPFINLNETTVPIDKDVLSVVGEKLIEEVSKNNLNIWKKYYKHYRNSASLRNRKKIYKQEIFDDKGVDTGINKTGVGLSKNGRITYKTKLYVPGEYMDQISKKETSSSSNELSVWSSSSDEN